MQINKFFFISSIAVFLSILIAIYLIQDNESQADGARSSAASSPPQMPHGESLGSRTIQNKPSVDSVFESNMKIEALRRVLTREGVLGSMSEGDWKRAGESFLLNANENNVIQLIVDSPETVRTALIYALGHTVTDRGKAIRSLRKIAESSVLSQTQREHALRALGDLEPSSFEALESVSAWYHMTGNRESKLIGAAQYSMIKFAKNSSDPKVKEKAIQIISDKFQSRGLPSDISAFATIAAGESDVVQFKRKFLDQSLSSESRQSMISSAAFLAAKQLQYDGLLIDIGGSATIQENIYLLEQLRNLKISDSTEQKLVQISMARSDDELNSEVLKFVISSLPRCKRNYAAARDIILRMNSSDRRDFSAVLEGCS